jgi:gliding motility-associated lipoprotein GldD
MQRKHKALLFICAVILLLIACNSTYTPKPKGYFNITFPARQYQKFAVAGVPYTFEYPVYANIVRDSSIFEKDPEGKYWYNIDFPTFGGRIYLSYKKVGGYALFKVKNAAGQYTDSLGLNVYDKMIADAYKLTNKNEVVASSIKDSLMRTPNGITGIYFKVGGNAATAKQFLLTDTTKHFLRGALYFDVTPNADSLKIVQNFLQQDIAHLINTFKWVNQ